MIGHPATGRLLCQLKRDDCGVGALAFSACGATLAVGGDDAKGAPFDFAALAAPAEQQLEPVSLLSACPVGCTEASSVVHGDPMFKYNGTGTEAASYGAQLPFKPDATVAVTCITFTAIAPDSHARHALLAEGAQADASSDLVDRQGLVQRRRQDIC